MANQGQSKGRDAPAWSSFNFTGTIGSSYSTPVTYSVGGQTLTFNDQTNLFELLQVGNNYYGTAFSTGTIILYAGGFASPAAPINLSFSTPVTQFGFNAEDYQGGNYTISFTAYDGATSLGTFQASGCDPLLNACGVNSPNGTLSFNGLTTTPGTVITSLVITDNSTDNIGLGPITFGTGTQAPTPEPGTFALLGSGLLGCLGMMRRKLRS